MLQHNDDGEQAFQDIVAELQFYCSGVLPSVAQRIVVRAIRTFARETCIFQTSIKPDVQEGVATYELNEFVPEGYDIMGIEEVFWCGECIDHISKCRRCRKPMTCGCAVAKFEMKASDCIEMHPCPGGGLPEDPLAVQVSLCPSYDLCSMPPELKKYADVIMLLAESYTMKIPKQRWTNFRVGEGKRREAMGELVDIRCHVNNNFTNEKPRVGECII